MEKRKNKRVAVEGDIQGRVVLSSDCDIRDISLDGIKFSARQRVLPATKIRLHIGRDGIQLVLDAVVVRSNIISTGTAQDGEGPLYEVAVSFATMASEDQEVLSELIAHIG